MSKSLKIFWEDLDMVAQLKVLDFYGLDNAMDANFDVVPLFVLETEEVGK